MDVRELRIGNYVKDVRFPGEYIQIEDIITSEGSVAVVNSDRALITNLIPIELTEEWLLKLGFYKSKNGDYKLFPSFEVQFVAGFSDGEIWVMTYSRSVHSDYSLIYLGCKIKYMHQIQNLCFALTGEELSVRADIVNN